MSLNMSLVFFHISGMQNQNMWHDQLSLFQKTKIAVTQL